MRVIRGAWSDETDACAGKAKHPIALVEAKADCVTERDIRVLQATPFRRARNDLAGWCEDGSRS